MSKFSFSSSSNNKKLSLLLNSVSVVIILILLLLTSLSTPIESASLLSSRHSKALFHPHPLHHHRHQHRSINDNHQQNVHLESRSDQSLPPPAPPSPTMPEINVRSDGSDLFLSSDSQSLSKMNGANFENIPTKFIGPNYSISNRLSNGGANFDSNNNKMPFLTNNLVGLNTNFGSFGANQMFGVANQFMDNENDKDGQKADTMNDMLASAFKKYDVKKYLLRKILGNSHDLDEDEGGFFSNKHLKRHGSAGVAAKVIGELIGIKIRETIEGFGKSFSEYAKEFTTRNFVNLGQLFSRIFKVQNTSV